jgi:hypothetical protein
MRRVDRQNTPYRHEIIRSWMPVKDNVAALPVLNASVHPNDF